LAYWLTNKLRIADWGAIQLRVDMLPHELDDPLHVAMLIQRGVNEEPDEVLVLVPDGSFMSKVPGFTEIDEKFIPTGLVPGIAAKVFRTTA
jgi:hypothetical protein